MTQSYFNPVLLSFAIKMWKIFLLVFVSLTWDLTGADTPANCTADDVIGDWIFYEGPITDSSTDCSSVPLIKRKVKLTLRDDFFVKNGRNSGQWTMVYNQGFQVVINYRNYFAFSKYAQEGGKVTSFCGETLVGKSHDVTLRHWACFYGKKIDSLERKTHEDPFHRHDLFRSEKPTREVHEKIVRQVNERQTNWKAEVHEPFVNKSLIELLNLRGGRRSWLPHRVKAALNLKKSRQGPERRELDWRNFEGNNYVSPVRNQGSCGSCYAFSSMGMLEARIRLLTDNKLAPVLSPQDIVSCTDLAQGCAGGFPFLIAGRYGWEKGVVEESCNPYTGADNKCVKEDCHRWYTAEYEYIGGYYGASNEDAMINALNRNGPLSVSFEVYPDFFHYKKGIYHYTGVQGFEPFITVNHAVLLVGYGIDNETDEKFWIVKNSWGESWGDKGYFKIRRGFDECGIESIAVQAFPIPY